MELPILVTSTLIRGLLEASLSVTTLAFIAISMILMYIASMIILCWIVLSLGEDVKSSTSISTPPYPKFSTNKEHGTYLEVADFPNDIERNEYGVVFSNPLYKRELKFLSKYPHILCKRLIEKDDFYYYVFNYRCSKLSSVPYLYIKGVCSNLELDDYIITKNFTVVTSDYNVARRSPYLLNVKREFYYQRKNRLLTNSREFSLTLRYNDIRYNDMILDG